MTRRSAAPNSGAASAARSSASLEDLALDFKTVFGYDQILSGALDSIFKLTHGFVDAETIPRLEAGANLLSQTANGLKLRRPPQLSRRQPATALLRVKRYSRGKHDKRFNPDSILARVEETRKLIEDVKQGKTKPRLTKSLVELQLYYTNMAMLFRSAAAPVLRKLEEELA